MAENVPTLGQALDSDVWAVTRAVTLYRLGELVSIKMMLLERNALSIRIVRADGTEERKCPDCFGHGGTRRITCGTCAGTGAERIRRVAPHPSARD